MPILALASPTSGACANHCAAGQWLCYGRAQSYGLRFCHAAAVAGQETVAACTLLDANYLLHSSFQRDVFVDV